MEKDNSNKDYQTKSTKFTNKDFEKSENVIKQKLKKRRKWIIILGIIVVVVAFSGISSCVSSCNKDREAAEKANERANESLHWPDSGIAKLLPEPESSNGYIYNSSNDYFSCYVTKTNEDAFNDYINQCKEKGFNEETNFSSTRFESKDKSSNKLTISFSKDKNEMDITLGTKAYFDDLDAKNKAFNEKYKSQGNNNSTNTSDLKSFLDSYEQFVDKYMDFMKKYKDSGFSPSMLKDYNDLLAQLNDFNTKISTWDAKKSSMSAQDLAYYTEVMTRCAQKLATVQ